MSEIIGYNGVTYVAPSIEQYVTRLLYAVAWLATKIDDKEERTSAEYAVEVMLYPEAFPPGALESLTLGHHHNIKVKEKGNE